MARTAAAPLQTLVDALTTARVFEPAQLAPYLSEFRAGYGADDAPTLATFLVKSGLLTSFQAETALAGEASRLTLGPYLLAEEVGTGSLGTVYQAVGRSDRKRYAVKVLPLRSLWNVHQAKKQVQLFATLPPHPAVVPLIDVDSSGGSHYLVWPFAVGTTVAAAVAATGPLPPAEVARLAAQIAEGLALCHGFGVSHGLLKPANVVIGPDGQARILDLGIGAILSENIADDESMLDTISTANATMGLLDCAAPETLNSPNLRTPAGDLYSFGCVLYSMLVGTLPFPDGNAIDKVLAHQTQSPRPPREVNPAVPAWLNRIVLHLLAKTPEARPADANDVLAALLAGETGGVSADTPTGQHTPWLPQPAERVITPPPNSQPTTTPSFSAIDFDAEAEVTTDPAMSHTAARPPLADPTDPLIGSSSSEPLPMPSILLKPKPVRGELQSGQRLDVIPPLPAPVQYQPVTEPPSPVTVAIPTLPAFARSKWRRMFNLLTFWKPPSDLVQLSIFGPGEISPGDNVKLQVFAHAPEAYESVCTLSRVFHQNGRLLATGFVDQEMPRGQRLGLHLAVANAGVTRAEVDLNWLGQPQPRTFEVHVPWESPAGRTPAILSAGVNRLLAGVIKFQIHVLPRRA